MCKYCSFILMVAALTVVGLAANAQADLLFSDNFNGATNPGSGDYGLNDNLSNRLTGTLAAGMISSGKAWDRDYWVYNVDGIQVNSSHGADMLACQAPGTTARGNAAIIQHNFNYGDFTLRFDMDPVSEAGATNLHGHAGFVFIGADDSTQSYLTSAEQKTEYDVKADFALHLGDYGKLRVRWTDSTSNLNGSSVYGGLSAGKYYTNEIVYDQARFDLVGNNSTNYTQEYTFEVRVTTDDYAQGTLASVELWIIAKKDFSWTPVAVDLNGTLDGNAATFHWDDGAANYIGFGSQSNTSVWSQVDDVSVSGEIPEPSTLALLAAGLIGLLAYAWRKRK